MRRDKKIMSTTPRHFAAGGESCDRSTLKNQTISSLDTLELTPGRSLGLGIEDDTLKGIELMM